MKIVVMMIKISLVLMRIKVQTKLMLIWMRMALQLAECCHRHCHRHCHCNRQPYRHRHYQDNHTWSRWVSRAKFCQRADHRRRSSPRINIHINLSKMECFFLLKRRRRRKDRKKDHKRRSSPNIISHHP